MNQPIQGYRQLSNEETALINRIKDHEQQLARLWLDVASHPTDPRWRAVARTHFQEGFSALVRSVAQPRDPFQVES